MLFKTLQWLPVIYQKHSLVWPQGPQPTYPAPFPLFLPPNTVTLCTSPKCPSFSLCSSCALCSRSPFTEKETKAQRKAVTYPGPYTGVRSRHLFTPHSCQFRRLPGLTVLLKLASFCALDFFQFSDRPIPLPQELPEEVAAAWPQGQGGKSAFFRKRKFFCVHFICSEKNGSSGQAWAKLFYEWGPWINIAEFPKAANRISRVVKEVLSGTHTQTHTQAHTLSQPLASSSMWWCRSWQPHFCLLRHLSSKTHKMWRKGLCGWCFRLSVCLFLPPKNPGRPSLQMPGKLERKSHLAVITTWIMDLISWPL